MLDSVNYRCELTCQSYVEVKSNSDFQQTGFRKWLAEHRFSCSCTGEEITIDSEQPEIILISESTMLPQEVSFGLRYVMGECRFQTLHKTSGETVPIRPHVGRKHLPLADSGASLPPPRPPPVPWTPGTEDRNFRGKPQSPGGPVEKFILNSIPKIRDPKRPAESIASFITDITLSNIFGTTRDN